ncbi:MAG TPA: 50S ribosomal protein L9 [Candidatus Ozemobacteraceae bacterium]|nr:50S ribosomal protein L9 [Candidatus Ozemobacteraceae bacterium]HQG26967.1 50S ribosomal protein L9 [Candidatus Ozemobacteraceae bacterium]
MQVLLIQNVGSVGKRGETKRVAEGYARNFLFPRNLAVPVTPGTMKNLEMLKHSWKRQEVKEKEEAQAVAKKIDGLTIKITRKSGEKGRLFGSVTNTEIAELIGKKIDMQLDKRSVVVEHIKELGEHEVTVKLFTDVKATVKLVVLPEEAAEVTA